MINFTEVTVDAWNRNWFTATDTETGQSHNYPLIVAFDTYTQTGPDPVRVGALYEARKAEILVSGLPPRFDIDEHVAGIYRDASRYGTE